MTGSYVQALESMDEPDDEPLVGAPPYTTQEVVELLRSGLASTYLRAGIREGVTAWFPTDPPTEVSSPPVWCWVPTGDGGAVAIDNGVALLVSPAAEGEDRWSVHVYRFQREPCAGFTLEAGGFYEGRHAAKDAAYREATATLLESVELGAMAKKRELVAAQHVEREELAARTDTWLENLDRADGARRDTLPGGIVPGPVDPFIAVMHAAFEPARGATLAALLERLGGEGPRVHVERDHDRAGAWAVARRCWERGLASGASHVIVMNDDALPCLGFRDVARAAIAGNPREVLCFYSNHPTDTANVLVGPWRTSVDGLVGVACAMPASEVRAFLAWHDESFIGDYSDDGRINLWAMCTRRLIWTTLPSLVDHQLPTGSLVGNAGGQHRRPVVPPLDDMTKCEWRTVARSHVGRVYWASHFMLLRHVRPEHWWRHGIPTRVGELELHP